MRALIGSSVAALIAIAGLMAAFAQVGTASQYAAMSVVPRIGGDRPMPGQSYEMIVAHGGERPHTTVSE